MIVFILFFLVLFIYAIFSYSLVDPNLVLSSNSIYWHFQQWMWSTFFHNGKLMAYIYFAIIISLFILYFHILEKLKVKKIIVQNIFKNKYILIFLLLIFPIFLSYNFLSHDVFNYIFYARMIVKYGADPGTHIALDFPNDLWTRFMHNTHVTSVYGVGWTYPSVVPYLLGLGKFSLTLISFRVWNFFGMILLYLSMQFFSKTLFLRNINLYELALVFLNPLLLIETLSNYHNDLWMMPFAIVAVGLLIKPITHKIIDSKTRLKFIIFSLIALAISVSIKMATLVLLPIWILVISVMFVSHKFSFGHITHSRQILNKFIEKFMLSIFEKVIYCIPDIAALVTMLLFLTPRSRYFLPWYIAWVIVWVPFMKIKIFRNLIIVFTISSSLRYLPWLLNNLEYTDQVLKNEKLITWLIPLIYLFTDFRKKIMGWYVKK